MSALIGKVAIITGASSGIGRAAAKLFADQRAKVVVSARRQALLEELVNEIRDRGGEAFAVAGDIRDERLHQALVKEAVGRFGGLDVGFNNAGMVGELIPVTGMEMTAWQEVVNTNLTSAFLAAKYQIPAMQKSGGGSMIFTSTFVGYSVGMPGMAAYAAGKSGLIGLTQCLAAEYGSENIRVNALLPGGTDTPMGRGFASTPEAQEFVKGLHALKRIADPEEIAQSALFLASGASGFTTGSVLLADGGVSVNRT